MNLRRTCAVLALMLIAGSAQANWEHVSIKDAMNDREIRLVMTRSQDGTLLSMKRENNKAVIFSISLPDNNMEMFDPKLGVMMRIDSNPPHDFKPNPALEQMGIKIFWWTPKSVTFVVWSGENDKKRSKFINEALAGSKLLVRVFKATSGIKDFEVSLEGLRDSAAKGLDIQSLVEGPT